MKINDTLFFKNNLPYFTPPPPLFLWEKSEPPLFSKILKTQIPLLFIKGERVCNYEYYEYRYQKLSLLYPGVFMAERISQNSGELLTTGLWILGLP